ncbi:MAG: hypothetical protein E7280_10835 [Lachnospiraceae bacterium]|nr:hypothetical protein [Lachnospiraceae bacterium]
MKVKRGRTATLKIVRKCEGDRVLFFKSSNRRIATVNHNGKITARKRGTTTITLKMKSGCTATCRIKVY